MQEFTNKDTSKWFGSSEDPETWIVLFHGTTLKGVRGILESKLINFVSRDAFADY